MNSLNVVRKIDGLGRITLPKDMRDILHMPIGTPLEFYVDANNNGIVLKKYNPDDLSEKVKELGCILDEYLDMEFISLDQELKIKDELDKIQTILNTSA